MTLRMDPAQVAQLLPNEPQIGLAPTAWELAAAWLMEHPRGEIRMRAAGGYLGFMVERHAPGCIGPDPDNPEAGAMPEDFADAFHEELLGAFAACMREGE